MTIRNEMTRFLAFFCLCLALAAAPGAISHDSDLYDSMPNRNTPKELAEAWLSFHEQDLCQGMDTVFVFSGDGMEVTTLIEDEKSYQKLEELLAPLRSSHKIELSSTRPPEEINAAERREPPASLWENYELRSFMGDPLAQARDRPGFDEDLDALPPSPDPVLKQRLLLYADKVLAWARKIERYAKDIPVLTHASLDPALSPELRVRANAICMAHAQNLGKYAEKLHTNLDHAFPYSRKKRSGSPQPEKNAPVLKTAADHADHLSDFGANVARRVYQFIHPKHYTVGLEELRRPGLLESLNALRKAALEFQKSLAKAR
jgi:hypothetical protein